MIWRENYPGSLPWAAVVFAGLLCLFEVVEYPSWARHNIWDWITGSAFAVLALAGLDRRRLADRGRTVTTAQHRGKR